MNKVFCVLGMLASIFLAGCASQSATPAYPTLLPSIEVLPYPTEVKLAPTSSIIPTLKPSAATGKSTERVYFSVVSSSGIDPWTKIGWLSLGCLAEQNACQSSIQTLPDSYQQNMADAPVWSPDGRRFALVSNSNGEASEDIFIMDANGENPFNLTHSPQREDHPVWSPDGAYLLYTKIFNDSEIWITRPDGTDPRKVVDGDIPAWSPDGRQILYIASRGQNGKTTIAIINVTGGDPVWEMTVGNSVYDLAWSPDGSQFAVGTSDGMLLMDRNGSYQNQFAPNLFRISDLAWSPDGRYIAFLASAARQAPPDLYTIHAYGSGLVNLTQSPLGVVSPASWSPDSNWLVYDSPIDSGRGNIFLSNPNGSKQYQLTRSDGRLDYMTPSWQP